MRKTAQRAGRPEGQPHRDDAGRPARPRRVHATRTRWPSCDGERRLTYAELGERAWRLANALRDAGSPRATAWPRCCRTAPAMLEAHFGVPAAGGVLVTVNTRLSSGEIDYILEHSGSRTLLARRRARVARGRLDLAGIRVIRVDHTGLPGDPYEDLLADASPELPESWLEDEEEVISINYTSGTTGTPKGVQYTYRGAYLNALNQALVAGLSPETVFLWLQPMFHCNGWCFTWAVTAVAGAPRHAAQGRPGPDLGPDRRGGRDELQRRADRAADDPQPSEGAPRRAADHRGRRRRAAVADAVRAHGGAQLPRRPRLRADRDVRADHRVPGAGELARAARRGARDAARAAGSGEHPRRPRARRRHRTTATSRATARRWARS